MPVQHVTGLKRLAFALAAVLAVFVAFQAPFFLFWDQALELREGTRGITHSEFERMRAIFWLMYGAMVALAALLGAALAWHGLKSRLLAAAAVAVAVGLLAYLSLSWLEFQNACNVGRPFLLESRC